MSKSNTRDEKPTFREHIHNIRGQLALRDIISHDGILRSAPQMAPLTAYALTIGLFFATGHATGVYNAIGYLGGWIHVSQDPPAILVQGMIRQSGYIAFALIVFVLTLHVLRIPRGNIAQPVLTKRSWKVFAVACLATFLGFGALAIISGGDSVAFPQPDDRSAIYSLSNVVDAFRAGITEEICLMALPVLFLRAARRPWTEIIIVLTVIRWSFHAYYGIPSLGLMIWAAAVILLFRYTCSILPIIAEHILFDLKFPAMGDTMPLIMGSLIAAAAIYGIYAVSNSIDPSPNNKRSKAAA
ncbi:hypothetical protein [uncultured Kocuria sp.]|uniref:hypothetical protein n=1 Tax=uncultured Kocuria sp. TaxID=259305 RepID=UPI0025996B40|nr:hypothetical protein [uncultured Kocuria sp.]